MPAPECNKYGERVDGRRGQRQLRPHEHESRICTALRPLMTAARLHGQVARNHFIPMGCTAIPPTPGTDPIGDACETTAVTPIVDSELRLQSTLSGSTLRVSWESRMLPYQLSEVAHAATFRTRLNVSSRSSETS